jgi:hypothetical protein
VRPLQGIVAEHARGGSLDVTRAAGLLEITRRPALDRWCDTRFRGEVVRSASKTEAESGAG